MAIDSVSSATDAQRTKPKEKEDTKARKADEAQPPPDDEAESRKRAQARDTGKNVDVAA